MINNYKFFIFISAKIKKFKYNFWEIRLAIIIKIIGKNYKWLKIRYNLLNFFIHLGSSYIFFS